MNRVSVVVDHSSQHKLSIHDKLRIAIRRHTHNRRGFMIYLITCFALIIAMLLSGFSPYRQTFCTSDDATANNGLQLSFVGDVMLGRYIEEYAQKYGYDHFFSGVSPLWSNSDHVFANLECAVLVNDAEDYVKDDKNIHLSSTVESILAMQANGIDTISYANNHSRDYGKQAFADAVAFFEDIDLNYSGSTLSYDERGDKIITCYLEADDKTIGFIGVNNVIYEGLGSNSGMLTGGNTGLYGYVNETVENCDITVVYVHWGKEYTSEPSQEQQEMARKLVDAGADIVIGSHPHCLQPIEKYGNGIIFYSLGNFIMDQGNTFTRDSILVQYNEGSDGSSFLEIIPLRIIDGRPEETSNAFYLSRTTTLITKYLEEDDYYIDDGHIIINFHARGDISR